MTTPPPTLEPGSAAANNANGGAVSPPLVGASSMAFWIGLIAVGVALSSGIATSLILTGATRIRPTDGVFLIVIFVNMALVLPLISVVTWQIWALWKSRREQAAGSRLHLRIVGLFSVIAMLPAIILAVFASISLNRALDGVFSKRVKSIVENSLDVARTYVDEHGTAIRSDIVAMARDLDEAAGLVKTDSQRFKTLFVTQAGLRDLSASYLIDGQGRVMIATSKVPDATYIAPPPGAMADAKAGQAVVIGPGRTTQVGAVKKLEKFDDTYLLVLRPVDAKVMRHLSRTEEGVKKYSELEQMRRGIQIASGIIYVVIALTLLLAAIWLGLWFANRLVAPIRRLIGAAQQISEGNLDVRVPVRHSEADLKQLSTTFNRMTSQIKSQRDDLMTANTQLLERRRFIEAVLSGVTAGVIGLDSAGRIDLTNPSAELLLGRTRDELVGRPFLEIVPEFARLLDPDQEPARKPRSQEQITLDIKGTERTFAVRVTQEKAGDEHFGSVVTFDDITELVSAQRTSAWADIARRIAHEIKNPLTPIQLSAERLKRKYSASITEDRDIFDKCVDTIVRRVGDIGKMVDEFSSFARMPKPEMEREDIRQVVREAVVFYEIGRADIDVLVKVPETPIIMMCDRRLITQAVTNLVKNASEAIQAVAEAKDAPPGYRGRIETRISLASGQVVLEVIDNGVGLPKQNRGRLIEPYVTTRAKGTGLGLAIVQKITEQHGGLLALEDAPSMDARPARGALVRMTLPLAQVKQDGGTKGARAKTDGDSRSVSQLTLEHLEENTRVATLAVSRAQAGE